MWDEWTIVAIQNGSQRDYQALRPHQRMRQALALALLGLDTHVRVEFPPLHGISAVGTVLKATSGWASE